MGTCSSTADNPKNKSYLLQVVDDHEAGINCAAVSEDGSVLATGSEDRHARLWSTKTDKCECIGILKGHDDYINCILIEENYVVTGSADKTIRKWDVGTCDCVYVFRGHNSLVNRIICTGDFVFSSSYDRTVRCWDFDTGECIRVFTGHKRGVYPMIFIPSDDEEQQPDLEEWDGNKDILISGSADFTARAWSFETGKCIHVFAEHKGAVTCMATDPAGKILFTGSTDSSIRSWNIAKGQQLKVFEGHTASVLCMTVVKKIMYTGSSDMTGRSWVTEFGDCTRTYKGHKHSVSCVKFHEGFIFTGSGDGVSRCFEAKSGELKRSFKSHENVINAVEVNVFTGCGDGVVRCFDAKSAALKRSFVGHSLAINIVQIVGGKMFTGSHDGTLRVWDITGLRDDTTFGRATDNDANKEKSKEGDKDNTNDNAAENGQTKIMIDDSQGYTGNAQNGALKGIMGDDHRNEADSPPSDTKILID